MTTVNNQVSFGATIVPLVKGSDNCGRALKAIENCFELKGAWSGRSAERVREGMNLCQAMVQPAKNSMKLYGGDREADEFIFREVSKVVPDAKYVQDTPETVFEGPVFELLG